MSTPSPRPSSDRSPPQAEPHSYDLCNQHARRLTAPRGWEVVRFEGEFAPPHTVIDDLTALAEAVREAGRADRPVEDAAGARHRAAAAICACCPARRRTDTATAESVPAPTRRNRPPYGSSAVTDAAASTATTAREVPRDDLSGLVKAYDVRGVVGEQIDAALVRERRRGAGPAAARGVRATAWWSSATTCATARPSWPAAFAEGVTAARPRRGRHRAGQHRHALLRLRRPGPARRDVHRQPQPGQVQRHQAVPGRRASPIGQDTGLADDP